MVKPILSQLEQLSEVLIHKYERYLPTAFDDSLTLLEKVNKVIEYLNQVGKLNNDVVEQWNSVMEWVMGEGIEENIETKLIEMEADGTLATIINETVFNDINTKISKMGVYLESYPRLGGETNDNGRFQRAFLDSPIVHLSNAHYVVSNLDVEGKTLIGVGKELTFIEGDGDLLLNAKEFTLKGVTIRNLNMRGKLVTAKIGVAIERSRFFDVNFLKANYHIYSANANGTVDWNFNHCVFNDADQVSRYFMNVWAYSEFDCYTWYNKVGLRLESGTNVRVYGSVFEYNTSHAVLINAINEMNVVTFNGVHFESNNTAGLAESIRIETVSATRIRNISFNDCSFMIPTGLHYLQVVEGSGGNINRITFTNCFTKGSLVNDFYPAILNNVEFNEGTIGESCIVVDSFFPKKFPTSNAGNDYDQTGAILIKNGESYRVDVGTLITGDNLSYAQQQFMVSRDSAGGIHVATLLNTVSGVSVVVTTESGAFRVKNGTGMSTTFQPSITLTKLY